MRGIEPDGAPAPTEPGDRELGSVRLARGFRESDSRIEVRIDLRVRHLGDDFPHYLLAIAHLRGIALPRIQLGRDREVPGFGEAAAEILDVLVDAENLLYDEHGWERSSLVRHRTIGGDLAVLGRHLDLAGIEPGGVGGNHGLRRNRLDREREAGGERGHHKAAPRPAAPRHQALQFEFCEFHGILPMRLFLRAAG